MPQGGNNRISPKLDKEKHVDRSNRLENNMTRCAECVAIGECGLDFNRNFSPPEVQIEVFEKQVAFYSSKFTATFVNLKYWLIIVPKENFF